MYGLIALILFFVLILPITNAIRLTRIERKLEKLGKSNSLDDDKQKAVIPNKEKSQKAQPVAIKPENIKVKEPPKQVLPKESSSQQMESKLATQLPVWIGGVALAFGGFYLVKYSIDSGLLSPAVRVMCALILGLLLVLYGQKQHIASNLVTSKRISQSLTGAGLATLYGAIYAATSLYEFVPNLIGFSAMGLVTGLAILLSLRQGPPIAVLGLVGGFVTPAIIGSDSPSVIHLFAYLYALYAAVLILARERSWVWIIPLASAASYIWVLLWYFVYASPADVFWLMLFITAALGLSLSLSQKTMQDGFLTQLGPIVYLGSSILGLLTFFTLSFGIVLQPDQVVLFGLLSAGTIVLAYFNEAHYRLYPLMSFVTAVSILLASDVYSETRFLTYFSGSMLLFVGGASLLYFRHHSRIWAGMIFASGLSFFVLGYIYFSFVYDLGLSDVSWASFALVFGLYGIYLVSYEHQKDQTHTLNMAIFAAMASSFVAIAMAVLWAQSRLHFFEIGILFEVIALVFVARLLNIRVMISYAVCFAVLYLILNVEALTSLTSMLMVDTIVGSETFYGIDLNTVVVDRLAYILPAVLFFVSGYKVSSISKNQATFFLTVGWVLAYLGLFALAAWAFVDTEQVKYGYVFNSFILNMTFAMGAAALYVNRQVQLPGHYVIELSFVFYGLFRLIYGHMLLGNPLWASVAIDGVPLFNTIWFTFALPIGWLYLTSAFVPKLKTLFLGLGLFFAFVFITLQVRSFFHLPLLNDDVLSNAEVYSYSAVWLLSAVIVLFYGILKKNPILRYAGLGLMLIVAAKVFLYDASALEGLYRVISFLGLGASLIGLSYVYARFVQDK